MNGLAKILFFVILLLPLVGFVGESIVDEAMEQETYSLPTHDDYQTKVQSSSLPYLPTAELIGCGAQAQQIAPSRLQRIFITEYVTTLKSVVQRMAERMAVLSQHQERIYDTTTSYYCHPASQYYVYTLRRIVI